VTNPQNSKKKKKGKDNKGNQGNQPNEPQGNQPNTNNQQQGDHPKQKKAIRMNKPCACCSVHGHYTHEYPLLPHMHQMWVAQETSRGQPPMRQLPQNLVPPQPVVLTNHFPPQGFVAAQPQLG